MSLQVALYIWDNGNGPHLTAVPELCTEPEDSPHSLSHCATALSSKPPLCVSSSSACGFSLRIVPDFPQIWQGDKIKQQHKTEGAPLSACSTSDNLWYSALVQALKQQRVQPNLEHDCLYTQFRRTLCTYLQGRYSLGLSCWTSTGIRSIFTILW